MSGEERFTHENVRELAAKIGARYGATVRSPNLAELGCTCEAYRGLAADPDHCPLHPKKEHGE